MKAVPALTYIWALCIMLVLRPSICEAARSSPAFHTKGFSVQAHAHLGSHEAGRDITILTDKNAGKQIKFYSSSHGGKHKHMEIELRELIYHVDYQDATTHPTTPSDHGSWPP